MKQFRLSKSKIVAYRQCPKRLWLEVHRPELKEDSAATQASFAVGHQVGDIARHIYDPQGKGEVIDRDGEEFEAAFTRTDALLSSSQPIFEAGFSAGGALAFTDVMLPARQKGKRVWRMIEVKATTTVKDCHVDDVAIQAFVARASGVALKSVALAHVDNAWIYPDNEDYESLLKENDLTSDAFGRKEEFTPWIAEAQSIARKRSEPAMGTGGHCGDPYPCSFLGYCQSQEVQPEFPASWLPRVQTKALKALLHEELVTELAEVTDDLLNERQLRVKTHTLDNTTFFDTSGAAADLASCRLPAYFLDFETISYAVFFLKKTTPYQQT